jgi:hypothetical protein
MGHRIKLHKRHLGKGNMFIVPYTLNVIASNDVGWFHDRTKNAINA